jgi:hypothetical protein
VACQAGSDEQSSQPEAPPREAVVSGKKLRLLVAASLKLHRARRWYRKEHAQVEKFSRRCTCFSRVCASVIEGKTTRVRSCKPCGFGQGVMCLALPANAKSTVHQCSFVTV